MYTYYHITPTKNVSRILRYGLRPASEHGLGLSSLKGENVRGKIHVTGSEEEARDIVCSQYLERWSESEPNWTVLRLLTAERGKVDPGFGGFEGFYYLSRPVPPRNIEEVRNYGDEEGCFVPLS